MIYFRFILSGRHIFSSGIDIILMLRGKRSALFFFLTALNAAF